MRRDEKGSGKGRADGREGTREDIRRREGRKSRGKWRVSGSKNEGDEKDRGVKKRNNGRVGRR